MTNIVNSNYSLKAKLVKYSGLKGKLVIINEDEDGFTFIHDAYTYGLRCFNTESVTIYKGSPVRLVGAVERVPAIALACSSAKHTAVVYGIADEDITPNQSGQVKTTGILKKLNTSKYKEGQMLYTGKRGIVVTEEPEISAPIGVVLRVSESQGSMLISIPGIVSLKEKVKKVVETKKKSTLDTIKSWFKKK